MNTTTTSRYCAEHRSLAAAQLALLCAFAVFNGFASLAYAYVSPVSGAFLATCGALGLIGLWSLWLRSLTDWVRSLPAESLAAKGAPLAFGQTRIDPSGEKKGSQPFSVPFNLVPSSRPSSRR